MEHGIENQPEFPTRLKRRIDHLNLQNNNHGLLTALDQYVQENGFTYTTLAQLINPFFHGTSHQDLFLTNLPQDYLKAYMDGRFFNYDPTLSKALNTDEPFVWTDFDEKPGRWTRKIIETRENFGVTNGLIIPIKLSQYPVGMASFSCKGLIPKHAKIDELKLLATTAYRKFIDQSRPPEALSRRNKPVLTDRQMEVIIHIACGKTDQEIAEVMNIAKNSVTDHANNIREKIGAKNRANCVMIAIRDGHVFL